MALHQVVGDIEQRCVPIGQLKPRVFDDPTGRNEMRKDALQAGALHPDAAPAAVLAELLARGWSSTNYLIVVSGSEIAYESICRSPASPPRDAVKPQPGARRDPRRPPGWDPMAKPKGCRD